MAGRAAAAFVAAACVVARVASSRRARRSSSSSALRAAIATVVDTVAQRAVLGSLDTRALREAYYRDGYVVLRNVFSPTEVAAMKRRFDWWREEMVRRHHTTFVCGNHRVWIDYDAARRRLLRGVQWPSYSDPVLDAFRLDPRLFAMVSAVQGTRDVKQIINQMHWKFPGSKTQWRYHQDKRSRRPAAAFRDLFTSYTNVGIAVEPFNAETGGMQVVPKSHLCRRDVGIEAVAAEMGISDLSPTAPTEAQLHEMLRRVGVDPAQLRTMDMAPGDVALWNPFLIHGGGLNTSRDCHRSFYIQGFVARDKGDRGHVAWLDGRRQPLGEPVLVHLEDFRETLAEGGRYYEQPGASSTREAKIQEGGGGGGGGGAAKQDDGAKAGGDDTEVHLVRD